MTFRPKIKNTNGTLTDLPLAAETAVKLKTSRSIGLSGVTATSQPFNGTSAITIPITTVPASLLTGTATIDTTGNAGTATMLSSGWTILTPGTTILPYGIYLIKVVLADNSSEIGNYGTSFTDVMAMQYSDISEYTFKGFDYPAGPLHIFVANGYESNWMKTARIKISSYTSTGFKLELYLSTSGGYSSSSTITGAMLFPTTLASSVQNVSYSMKYKKIM